jgi:hypothetical protein
MLQEYLPGGIEDALLNLSRKPFGRAAVAYRVAHGRSLAHTKRLEPGFPLSPRAAASSQVIANPIIGVDDVAGAEYVYWMGPAMLQQRIQTAVLVGLLFVAAAAWWGLSSVGTGQPVAAQSASAITVAGRVEGGSDVLSLGTSATGTIAALLVKAGDHVQPGQHLVRVECSKRGTRA